ncbi:MAG: outer membrane lipoprotein chaperone LolA [Thalassotalea sp.]
MHYLSQIFSKYQADKKPARANKLSASGLVLSAACLTLAPSTFAAQSETSSASSQLLSASQPLTDTKALGSIKKTLMAKLKAVNYFTASFSQQVFDNDKNLIQQGRGKLIVSKPNKVYWQTTEPEESLIVSDGETLWLYDPFIEQVSLFSYQASIENTPILLITSESNEVWSNYSVTQPASDQYQIISDDEQSQVTSLTVTFSGKDISQLVITDVTGQTSEITLSENNHQTVPDAKLFTFTVPQGVHIDDQR